MLKFLVASVVFLVAAVASAGDLVVSASGFPDNHRGNGTFTLKQVLNPNTGKLIDCWSQNNDNDGWVASFSENGGILTVSYCRNGFPQAVYRVTGTTLSSQNLGLATRIITGPVPQSVSVSH